MTVNKKIYDAFIKNSESLEEIEIIDNSIKEKIKKLENPIHKEYKDGDYERFKEDDDKLKESIANEKINLDAKLELLKEILELIPEDDSSFIYDEHLTRYNFSKSKNNLKVKSTYFKAHAEDIVKEKVYILNDH